MRLLFLSPAFSLSVPFALFLVFARSPALPLSLTGAQGADRLPIFDAHIHYNRDAWTAYPPDEALAILDQAGVYRALVSSTPDDGTLALHERAPDRIVPILRPYRTPADQLTWTRDPTVLSYVEERLERGIYRGIGEFHLVPGQATAAVPSGFAGLVAARGLFLHAHTSDVGVEELLNLRPDIEVLWAHAGMTSPPSTVGSLLARHPNLWVELAIRYDVAPGGVLDPQWAALFRRYPDRFMIGTDTWVNTQWARLPQLIEDVRTWLRQLPPDVAEQIAFRTHRLAGALPPDQRRVDQEGQRQQDDAQRQRQREVALAGLQRDGGRQDAGLSDDVAADHKRGPDLGDRPPEGGRDRHDHLRSRRLR
jgi:hypothetical protein